jgi:hypothetical protein
MRLLCGIVLGRLALGTPLWSRSANIAKLSELLWR